MGFQTGGLLGLVILIADIWAIIQVYNSSVSTAAKLGSTPLILVLPVLGLVIWFFMAPRSARPRSRSRACSRRRSSARTMLVIGRCRSS